MTNQNLLLTAGTAALFYYFFILKKANHETPTDELELTLDKLIFEINQLNNQI